MFYTPNVDISSVKSMWNFLHDHFTYYTMNSWNRAKSIAHNVKLYNLKLEGDWTVALRYLNDENDSGELNVLIEDTIRDWECIHPGYTLGFNGRSNGYLVLYDKYSSGGSVLPDYVTDYDYYEDFKTELAADYGFAICECLQELRDITNVVRDFDKLCDELRDLVNAYSKRSFDTDKLEAAVEWFNNEYGDDLVCLELTGPVLEGDRVKLNDIAHYHAFMQCFIKCLGEDYSRIDTDREGEYLWLKEN